MLIFIRHNFILYVAKPLIKAVYLCTQILNILHKLIGLLLLQNILMLRLFVLLHLIVFFLSCFLQFVLVFLNKVLQLLHVPLELYDLTVSLLIHLV